MKTKKPEYVKCEGHNNVGGWIAFKEAVFEAQKKKLNASVHETKAEPQQPREDLQQLT